MPGEVHRWDAVTLGLPENHRAWGGNGRDTRGVPGTHGECPGHTGRPQRHSKGQSGEHGEGRPSREGHGEHRGCPVLPGFRPEGPGCPGDAPGAHRSRPGRAGPPLRSPALPPPPPLPGAGRGAPPPPPVGAFTSFRGNECGAELGASVTEVPGKAGTGRGCAGCPAAAAAAPRPRCCCARDPRAMITSRTAWHLGSGPSGAAWKTKDLAPDGRGQDGLGAGGGAGASPRAPLLPALLHHKILSVSWPDTANPRGLCRALQALRDTTCKRREEPRPRAPAPATEEPPAAPREAAAAAAVQAASTMNLEKAGGRLCGGKRASLSTARPFPVIQEVMASMAHLQKEKLRLQEELLELQEKLAAQENNELSLSLQLQGQVETLKAKLLEQAQEISRLRSELGGTDAEKHRDLLAAENERLRQEMKALEGELRELQRQQQAPCRDCPHLQENAELQEQLSQLQREAEEARAKLVELDLEVQQKTNRLAEVELRLKDSLAERAEEEERLSRRLRDSQETIASLKSQPQQIKYIIKTVEVESAKVKQALCETQSRNQYLQEQVGMQKQVLKEMEQQLQNSQKTEAQLRAQIMMYEAELERAHGQMLEEMQAMEEEKNHAIEEAFSRAQVEMKAVHENLAGVRTNLLTLQPALRTLTHDYNSLKRQVRDFPLLLQETLRSARAEISQAIEEVHSTNRELLRKYRRELQLRKKCHNELVRLKGNIRVFGRVRPITKEDGDGPEAANAVTFDADDDAVLHLLHKGKQVSFELDKVFPPQASQEEVFQEVQALVTSCIDGYNVCIFAYGQTGAGKTYTMEGTAANPGINQRALQLLFSEVRGKAADWDYTITVSAAEIYNEALRDLLGKEPQEKLEIKLCPDGSGQLYVPGLTEFRVQSVEDINKVFEFGHIKRVTECTNLNEHSSRSHALLIVTVRGLDRSTGLRTTGKLNLVDLAGSERVGRSGAEGSRLREAQHINKSLSALGDVIYALRSRQGHVPFRNSKLTYLLQDSLSGDSKTLMMVQVSPAEKNTSETLCSLKFAERVRSVELGPVSRKAELGSWPSQEHLEGDSPGPAAPPGRGHASPSPGQLSSRSASIRRKLQTSA
ncbi:kinesin-like protein KIFC3 isoform X2 [Motacilla alba alba]|uniref:kinesin-like protein KIFC3 isoform X2 n=1 Tax=Motacilla alba alba TaxID=1094192 RepID=UPI0018D51FE4|nr:kinesin-like protein KIFC3 isoform X2 [Motacilla alba alba]